MPRANRPAKTLSLRPPPDARRPPHEPNRATVQAGQLLADALGETLAVLAPTGAGYYAVKRERTLTPAERVRVVRLLRPRDLLAPPLDSPLSCFTPED